MLIYNPAFDTARGRFTIRLTPSSSTIFAVNRTVTSDADGPVTVGVDQRGGAPWHTNWHAVT